MTVLTGRRANWNDIVVPSLPFDERGCWITSFPLVDTFEGEITDPQSLHKYLYANADPVNFSDPTGMFAGFSGTLMSLAIGTSMRAIGVSAVVGGAMGGMGYLISAPIDDWNVLDSAKSILWGSAMGAFGATIIGGAWFAVQGVYQGMEVWRNPNATGLQNRASAN